MDKVKYCDLIWIEKEYYKRVTMMNTNFIAVLRDRISGLEGNVSELERIIDQLKKVIENE